VAGVKLPAQPAYALPLLTPTQLPRPTLRIRPSIHGYHLRLWYCRFRYWAGIPPGCFGRPVPRRWRRGWLVCSSLSSHPIPFVVVDVVCGGR
jgi:hypothetical protein